MYNVSMEDFATFRKQVAKNLTYYLKKCGLTQSAVAEKLNYSDKAVSKWERGDGIPDAYVLSNLAIIYGVSIDTLLSTTKEQIANEPELEEIISEKEYRDFTYSNAFIKCKIYTISSYIITC